MEHGLEIVREYKDRAKSGRTTKGRSDYLRMLDEMPRLKPSTLIVWHGNRLGRNAFDTLRMRMDAVEQGVELVYTDGQAPDMRDMMGLIAAVVEDTQSEDFSDKLSADIRRGIQHNAERGLYCGRPILGYVGEAGKPYAIDEKTAPVVRRIFTEYAGGASMQQIADELNAQGIRTSWGNDSLSTACALSCTTMPISACTSTLDMSSRAACPPLSNAICSNGCSENSRRTSVAVRLGAQF